MSRRMNWRRVRYDLIKQRDVAERLRSCDRTTLEARAVRETRRWLRTLHPRQQKLFPEITR